MRKRWLYFPATTQPTIVRTIRILHSPGSSGVPGSSQLFFYAQSSIQVNFQSVGGNINNLPWLHVSTVTVQKPDLTSFQATEYRGQIFTNDGTQTQSRQEDLQIEFTGNGFIGFSGNVVYGVVPDGVGNGSSVQVFSLSGSPVLRGGVSVGYLSPPNPPGVQICSILKNFPLSEEVPCGAYPGWFFDYQTTDFSEGFIEYPT